MGGMSYQLIEKQVIFDGSKVRLELHHLQDDETGNRTRREVCVHSGAVVILAVRDDGKVLLIKNRRYAAGGQVLIELPAGTLEKNEDPMNCAGRELLEETGYLAGKIRPLGTFYTSPGILSERMYAFAASDLEKQETALEEGEEIELLPTSLADAVQMIKDGEIQDGKTIATLLMYERFGK